MKTPHDNEVAIGSERRSGEASSGEGSINNSRDEVVNTPTMDFDDWTEDPFTLSKENDVFSSFSGVDEEVANDSSNTNPAPFPSSSSHSVSERGTRAGIDIESNADYAANSQSRKRNHSQRSSQKETNSSTGTGEDSKSTVPAKKKSDYIPISRRKKKPKGMPKRPLSAYNLYFQAERTKIIANQQEGNGPRIGFEGLGKIIGKQWRDLSSADKKDYEKLAEKDSERYRKEMDAYHEMKAKRFAEEDRRAAEQAPVLSSIVSSTTNSVQASSFDPNFVKQQGSLQVVPVAEAFGNPILLTHPPKSMVSAISSLPPGATSISYRPIQMEQPPSPPRHALPHNGALAVGAEQGAAPPLYFSHATGAHRPEGASYDTVAIGPGGAIAGAAPHNKHCPMPPGMEVVLSDRNGVDRKYRVQYTCYSMTRENANKYIESVTGVNSSAAAVRQRPPATAPNREYGEWGV